MCFNQSIIDANSAIIVRYAKIAHNFVPIFRNYQAKKLSSQPPNQRP